MRARIQVENALERNTDNLQDERGTECVMIVERAVRLHKVDITLYNMYRSNPGVVNRREERYSSADETRQDQLLNRSQSVRT